MSIDLFGVEVATDEDSEVGNDLSSLRAEFLVAAEIARQGFRVHHLNGIGYDLIVENGVIHRVQVKSSKSFSFNVKKDLRRPTQDQVNDGAPIHRPVRSLNRGDCDIIALFSYAVHSVVFFPVEQFFKTTSYRIPRPQFLKLAGDGILGLLNG